ncbi:MAG: hypothetical protein B6D65_05305, partial [candidate division Zixibacteria bacterium 4484_93]
MFKRFFVCTALLLLLAGAIFSEEGADISSSVDTTDSASIRSPETVGLTIGKAGEDVNFISDHVGIGTTSPGEELHLEQTVGNVNLRVRLPSGQTWDFGIRNVTDNQVPFVITPSNYVGIGTTSPGYKLDVSGNARFTGTVKGASATADDEFVTKGQISGGTVGYWAPNGSSIYNTNSGNVGIGTTSPTVGSSVRSSEGDNITPKLHIYSNTNNVHPTL